MVENAKPVRLQLSRRKGFNLQVLSRATNGLEAVNVARPSMWGNPFVIGQPSGIFAEGQGLRGKAEVLIPALTRDQVVEFYETVLSGCLSPEMYPAGHNWLDNFHHRYRGFSPTEAARSYLRGRNLACRCELNELCHADALLRIANG